MIQKLSKLQKQILCGAMQNGGKFTNKQALRKIYGFPLAPNGRHFDRSKISFPCYNSAAVAVVKSFDRLVRRGLAARKYNFGIILTDDGINFTRELAMELSSAQIMRRGSISA